MKHCLDPQKSPLTDRLARLSELIGRLRLNSCPENDELLAQLDGEFARLRQVAKRLNGFIQSSHQAIFLATLEGIVQSCNQALADMMGYACARDLQDGSSFTDRHFRHPELRQRLVKRLLRDGKLVNEEIELVRKDGMALWVLANVRLGQDGLVEVIFSDITARKLAEDELRRNEERQRRILETTAQGFVLMDKDLRIVDMNEAWRRITGYRREELLGKTPLTLSTDEYREHLNTNRENLLSREARVFESRLVDRDGREVPVLIHANTLRGEDGEVQGHAAFVTDLTEQKRSLVLAGKLQRHLMPHKTPKIRGFTLSARYSTSEEMGGDYVDFLPAGGADAALGIAVGDVTGHGADAALLMATARAYLRANADLSRPAEILEGINRELARDTHGTGRFMTLFFMVLDPLSRTLRWVRAGHDPALLITPDGECHDLLGSGTALGVNRDFQYSCQPWKAPLAPGTVVAVGTDGLWEARSPSGEMFGKERYKEIILKHRQEPGPRIVDEVFETVQSFTGHTKPDDDRTMVVLKAVAPEESSS